MGQEDMNDNIWDRIFKTLFLYMPEMFLPLINEVFQENYDKSAELIPLNNEFYNKDNSKVVSDTAFMVNGKAYHFECQFSNDKEMAFRMFEYDFHIGLSNLKSQKRIDEFDFPKSCVVYITTNKNNPKKLSMKVNFPNGSHIYEVETIRVHDYKLENIQKKKLFVFLPYFALQYPQKLRNKKPPSKEEIVGFYKEMLEILETAYNDNIIDLPEYNILLETIKEAEQRVFYEYEDIKEEVDSMVSSTLELKSLKMRDEAVNLAIKKAEKKKIEAVEKATKKTAKQTTLELVDVMKKIGVSEAQVQEVLKYAMEKQESE